jgi:hypothetical protein
VQQLLWIETLLKLSAGLLLVVAPGTTIRLFGLPQTDASFWPRLLGALLIGLAGALFLEGRLGGSHGLGLAGCILVNLAGVTALSTLLVVEAGPPTLRGRTVVWLVVLLLLLLSILEFANL